MKDSPFIISLLIGLIVVLVIGGVSLLVKMNSLTTLYRKELAKNHSLSKNIEDLKSDKSDLDETVAGLHLQIEELNNKHQKETGELKEEYEKLRMLKEKLEEDLKEELMRTELEKQ